MAVYGNDRRGRKYGGGVNPSSIYRAHEKKKRDLAADTYLLQDYRMVPLVDFDRAHLRIRGKGLKGLAVDIYPEPGSGLTETYAKIPKGSLKAIEEWARAQKPESFRALVRAFREFKERGFRASPQT